MINPVGNKGPEDVVRSGGTEEAAAAKKLASAQGDDKKKGVSKPAEGDKVELSTFARDIQTIRQRLGDQAAERAAKVEALREKVEQGTYEVDTKALAQKVYDSGALG